MPEEQNVAGEQWTLEAIDILRHLGWTLHVEPGFDITCQGGRRRSAQRGIDALLSYIDPYNGRKNGVLLEAKSYQWRSINTSSISEWVDTLITKLECAEDAPELQEFECGVINTAILVIWTNDGRYNHTQYLDYLKNLRLPNKRTPLAVYILSNHDILRLCSIIDMKERIRLEEGIQEVSFFYPSVNQSSSLASDLFSLKYMYSSFVFAKAKKNVTYNNQTFSRDISIVFYFGKLELADLNFMYSAFKQAQLEDANEIRIYFYGQEEENRLEKREFKNRLEEEYCNPHAKKTPDIMLRHLNMFPDIPSGIITGRGYE